MIFEIDKETINFICNKNITFNQFCICLLIYKKDLPAMLQINEEIGIIGDCLIPKGISSEGKPRYINEIEDLIDKGFLIKHDLVKDHTYDLDNFVLSPKFTENFLTDTEDICEQLWELYPKKILIDGIEHSAKSCDYDEFCEKYLKVTKGSVKKHKEILEKLRIYNSITPYATMGIMKWVGSREWENLEINAKPRTRSI